ncbi:glycosyltransferase family A protein [Micrococcus luteus]
MPVYNTGTLALGAARSAQAALGGLNCVVVVDDGSRDPETLAVLDTLREEGFMVLRQPNGGVSSARNAGIRQLTTPYVIALDSDDEILPDAPQAMAQLLDRNPDVAIVTGGAFEVSNGAETLSPPPDRAVTREEMRDFTLLATASLFRRSDWEAVGGFPEGLSMGEDWVFWMRILRAGGKVEILDAPIARRHLGSHQVTSGYIDFRQSAKARAVIRAENADLYAGCETELIELLNTAELQLAAYRHAYRHADRLKARIRCGLGRL